MKVLEKRIKKEVNKQMKFIEGNIEYFTNEQLIIIQDTINRINKLEKSVEILSIQGIIDRKCYLSLIDFLYEMKNELYKYKYQIKGLK